MLFLSPQGKVHVLSITVQSRPILRGNVCKVGLYYRENRMNGSCVMKRKEENVEIEVPRRCRWIDIHTDRQVSQSDRHTGRQEGRQAGRAGRPAGRQAGPAEIGRAHG